MISHIKPYDVINRVEFIFLFLSWILSSREISLLQVWSLPHLDISSLQVLLFAFVCAASGRVFLIDDGGKESWVRAPGLDQKHRFGNFWKLERIKK